MVGNRLNAAREIWSALLTWCDRQTSFHLLRYYVSAFRLIYTLRTAPPHLTSSTSTNFDQELRGVQLIIATGAKGRLVPVPISTLGDWHPDEYAVLTEVASDMALGPMNTRIGQLHAAIEAR